MGTLKRVQALLTKTSQVNRSVLRFSKNINEDGWLSDVSHAENWSEPNASVKNVVETSFK